MCSACHGVGRPARSAQAGIASSSRPRTRIADEAPRRTDGEAHDPQQLDEADPRGVPQRDGTPGRVLVARPQPLGHERRAHDHVADHRDREVEVVERSRDPGGDDEHARDLDEREQPVDDVVGVVRGREPREVHPGPPDREEHDQIAHEAVSDLARREVVMERARGLRDRHHEAQVEQQFERRRRSVGLVPVASAHRDVERPHRSSPGGFGHRISGGNAGHRSRASRRRQRRPRPPRRRRASSRPAGRRRSRRPRRTTRSRP